MKSSKEDPVKIIPAEYKIGNYKINKFFFSEENFEPAKIIVEIMFSYGGTTRRNYLDILKDYLNSK